MKGYGRKAYYWLWSTDSKARGYINRLFKKAERSEQKQRTEEAFRTETEETDSKAFRWTRFERDRKD